MARARSLLPNLRTFAGEETKEDEEALDHSGMDCAKQTPTFSKFSQQKPSLAIPVR